MTDELVQVLLEGWDEKDRARMLGVLAAANTPDAEVPGQTPREPRRPRRSRSRPADLRSAGAPAGTEPG